MSFILDQKHKIIVDSFLLQYPYRFFVYGSRAKKTAKVSSDLDLCIMDPLSIEQYAKIKTLSTELPVPFSIDIISWHHCDEEFRSCIKNDLIPYVPDLFLNATISDLSHPFIRGGTDIAQLALKSLAAPCSIIHITLPNQQSSNITVAMLEQHEALYGPFIAGQWVLFMTGSAKKWDDPISYRNADQNNIMHFPGITFEAAQLLKERKILGIGIDTFSLGGDDITFPVHKLFLQADVLILENIAYLESSSHKHGYLLVLPLPIMQGAEALARVIFIQSQS